MSAGDLSEAQNFKRDTRKRVFVNRSLNLMKIKYFGFDMDYTLAEYISPAFEDLGFRLTLERLVATGYPKDLLELKYDHTFAVRGLWFDSEYGNLLKVDAYGNIMMAVHGLHFMTQAEIVEVYPNKSVSVSTSRIFVLNTLFNMPESFILASLVAYFDRLATNKGHKMRKGNLIGSSMITYRNLFQDVRGAVDYAHIQGDMKKLTVEKKEEYVRKDPRLPLMLDRLRQAGAQVFLLTNSGFEYTKHIMTYLLNAEGRTWQSYFDYVVVDAGKPKWFGDGTALRKVNQETGDLGIGSHVGPLVEGQVYSGGSCDEFTRLVGVTSGREVLYVGDHIFGDVLRSKKTRGWRTFLIVPELQWELQVWTERHDLWEKMGQLERLIAKAYRPLDSSYVGAAPDVAGIQSQLAGVKRDMDRAYSSMGSLFRSGSRQTFFASQVERYADLYAASAVNLLYYPFKYYFRAPPMLMPHESTVEHRKPADSDPALPPVLNRGHKADPARVVLLKGSPHAGGGSGSEEELGREPPPSDRRPATPSSEDEEVTQVDHMHPPRY